MNSLWYNMAVVFLWLSTMGWLVVDKVLPSLLIGEPPSNRTIIAAQRIEPLVGWEMYWNERPVGWALSLTTVTPRDLTEVRGRIHFDRLPLDEILPPWLVKQFPLGKSLGANLSLEARTELVFDPLRRLAAFESAVGFQPDEDLIRIRGAIDDSELRVSFRMAQITYDVDPVTLSTESLLRDALSPRTHLPDLKKGQTWTIEVYSPFRVVDFLNPLAAGTRPMQIVQATVEEREPIYWQGRMIDAWLVVYRADPGAESTASRNVRGRLWVDSSGTVLKQETTLFNATMTFLRLSDDETVALADEVDLGQTTAE